MMMMVMMMFNSIVRWGPTGLGPPDYLSIKIIMRILTIIMMNMMMISKSWWGKPGLWPPDHQSDHHEDDGLDHGDHDDDGDGDNPTEIGREEESTRGKQLVFGIARKYKKVLMRPGQITLNIECVVLLLKAGRDSFSEAFTQLGVIDSNDFENSKSYGDVYEAEMAMMKM